MNFKILKHVIRLIIIIVLLAIIDSSCFTVKYSTSGASISPDLKTLSVIPFQNRSSAPPSFSQDITNKLIDKCRSNTSLTLITEGGEANFEGEIIGYDTRPTAIQGNETAAQNRFTITIHVRFTNSVDPKFNFDTNFSRYKDYGSSLTLDDAANLYTPEIVDQLLEDIFNKAFVNW